MNHLKSSQIELPDETPARQRLYRLVEQLCSVWLRTGIATAPSETHAVLHDYIRDVPLPGTRAVLLIVEIASYANAPSDPADPSTPGGAGAAAAKQVPPTGTSAAGGPAHVVGDNCSTFVHSLELKARYPISTLSSPSLCP